MYFLYENSDEDNISNTSVFACVINDDYKSARKIFAIIDMCVSPIILFVIMLLCLAITIQTIFKSRMILNSSLVERRKIF